MSQFKQKLEAADSHFSGGLRTASKLKGQMIERLTTEIRAQSESHDNARFKSAIERCDIAVAELVSIEHFLEGVEDCTSDTAIKLCLAAEAAVVKGNCQLPDSFREIIIEKAALARLDKREHAKVADLLATTDDGDSLTLGTLVRNQERHPAVRDAVLKKGLLTLLGKTFALGTELDV